MIIIFIEIFTTIFFLISVILIFLLKPTSVKINILGLKLELEFKKSEKDMLKENENINDDNKKEN